MILCWIVFAVALVSGVVRFLFGENNFTPCGTRFFEAFLLFPRLLCVVVVPKSGDRS